MTKTITIQCTDGHTVQYVDNGDPMAGGMKDVYFSPCKSYVVAFYRDPVSTAGRERLEMITGTYRERIFSGEHGEYWRKLFCWPERIVEHNGKIGIVVPTYDQSFFFDYGSKNDDMLGIKGKEKQGKWFASASNQNRVLDDREKGDWLGYLRICLMIARAVRRLHAAGLAHSDLSYKNVLVSPVTPSSPACIIDIDGLVVPNKYAPDVLGTPDFIAPEVVATKSRAKDDPHRMWPSITTDRHALAVLIYHYLLLRHPLRGEKVHDQDPQIDELLTMGERALFIENASDPSNRLDPTRGRPTDLPWRDTQKLPYTLTGPYLTELFNRAFIDGLHDPGKRPTADEWERALVKTVDLIQPCSNSGCQQKWFVFDNTHKPACSFCGQSYKGLLPVINLYSEKMKGKFSPDNHRLMVYSEQSLYQWHTNRLVFPNERLSTDQKKRVGYFLFHNNHWLLVNESIPELKNVKTGKIHRPGEYIELTDGIQLLVCGENGRLFVVQMVSGS